MVEVFLYEQQHVPSPSCTASFLVASQTAPVAPLKQQITVLLFVY